MKIHENEWQAAQQFGNEELSEYPRLTEDQKMQIQVWARELRSQVDGHPYLHNLLSILILVALLAADIGIVAWGIPNLLGHSVLSSGERIALFVFAGLLHGYLVYSYNFFTLHEGAGHRTMFVGHGRFCRWLKRLGYHSCRIFDGDPDHYRPTHIAHHAHFGTREDRDFTNFVFPARFFKSLMPFAFSLPFNDFRGHCGARFTRSRTRSALITSLMTLMLSLIAYHAGRSGLYVFIIYFALGPWTSFTLDRLSNSTVHNLMPRDRWHGTRDLGCGFWGMLISGGPWGQPCHWMHHLAPALPWYQQIKLHYRVKKILSLEQLRFHTIESFWDYPRFLMRWFQTSSRYSAPL